MGKLFMEHLTLIVMLLEVGIDVLSYGIERREMGTVQKERNAETELHMRSYKVFWLLTVSKTLGKGRKKSVTCIDFIVGAS